jgi:hypothetical protein
MHSAYTTIRARMRSAGYLGLDYVRSLQHHKTSGAFQLTTWLGTLWAVGMMVLQTSLPGGIEHGAESA